MVEYTNEHEKGVADWYEMTVPTKRIDFICGDYHIFKKEPFVIYKIAQSLLNAQQSVYLQSPYIVMNRNLKDFIAHLSQTVPSCTYLTNSMASTPNVPAFSNYLMHRKWMTKQNLSLYEYQSNHAIHAKTYIVDDHLSLVGSNNLDPRSFNIDTELMLAVDSEEFTAILKDAVGEFLNQSLQVDLDGTYREVQNQTVSPINVSKIKKCVLYCCGVVFWPVRYLL